MGCSELYFPVSEKLDDWVASFLKVFSLISLLLFQAFVFILVTEVVRLAVFVSIKFFGDLRLVFLIICFFFLRKPTFDTSVQ